LALSLAVHELATNAAKFGALSRPGGGVSVEWRLLENGDVDLTWSETGGPMVVTPTVRGFGSKLIERALAMETGGWANLRFPSFGVICDVHLPASSVAAVVAGSEKAVTVDFAIFKAEPILSDRYRLLVVEDSFLIVAILENMFEDLGWEMVGPASRLSDALSLAESETFDLALLDVNLNGEMSWEVALALKRRGIPHLFCSGYDLDQILPPGLGGSAVIRKPYKSADVERRIREIITAAR